MILPAKGMCKQHRSDMKEHQERLICCLGVWMTWGKWSFPPRYTPWWCSLQRAPLGLLGDCFYPLPGLDTFYTSPAPRCQLVLWGPCCGAIDISLSWEQFCAQPVCHRSPFPRLHCGSSLIFPLFRFIGIEKVSYTTQSRKKMRKGSILQSSGFGRSHFVQAPCDVSSTN